MQPFQGLLEDTYTFFWDIAFHNEIAYFEENRKRYERVVKKPLLELASALGQTALEVDASFDVRPSAVVSRIRRDTRYAPIDAPYRDHAFLTYRYPGMRLGESFVLYVEFMRETYGYGMGLYGVNPQFMADLRKRILARPTHFLQLAQAPALEKFQLEGEEYKRPKCPDAPKALWPWLNKRGFYYAYSSKELKNTLRPELMDEIVSAFHTMKPLYRFIKGLD